MMKRFLLVITILICINAYLFAGEDMENWAPSNIAIKFPVSVSFGDLSLSAGIGLRVRAFADLYIHPSISYAMIFETRTVTGYLLGTPFEREETQFLSRAAFRIALEYTVFKYSAIRRVGPFRILTHLNPRVRVHGDIGPIIGITYMDGFLLDAGINWREGHWVSAFAIQYNLERNQVGFLISLGYAF